jgi:hypothetical protein
MRLFLAILAILLPLAVMAAQAGSNSLSRVDSQIQWGALPTKASPAQDAVANALFQKDRNASFVIAHSAADSPGKDSKAGNGSGPDLDLRDVDWDSIKAGKKGKSVKNGKNGNIKNRDNGEENGNGEEEGKNGEDEEGEKKGEDEKEKDEGGGGWDRLWDAAKLG